MIALPEYENASFVVTTSEELNAAIATLSMGTGGTVYIDPNADPMSLSAVDLGANGAPVLITSLNESGDPATLTTAYIENSSNLQISGLNIDQTGGNPSFDQAFLDPIDVQILGSNNIILSDNIMKGVADGFQEAGDPNDNSGVSVRDSSEIAIIDNDISGYRVGIVYLEVIGLDITGNDIYNLTQDGLKGGGIQDVLIAENHIHDFYGSANEVNHDDMIQIFSTGRTLTTKNVLIENNVLDNNTDAATQGIFINNEDADRLGLYEDIVIRNNIVNVGMPNGIYVRLADGVVVEDNTVVWAQDTVHTYSDGSSVQGMMPAVRLTEVENDFVEGNVAGRVAVEGQIVTTDNYILNYDNPSYPTYAPKHFNNYPSNSDDPANDLGISPDSPIYGLFGAYITQTSFGPDQSTDDQVVTDPPVEDPVVVDPPADDPTQDPVDTATPPAEEPQPEEPADTTDQTPPQEEPASDPPAEEPAPDPVDTATPPAEEPQPEEPADTAGQTPPQEEPVSDPTQDVADESPATEPVDDGSQVQDAIAGSGNALSGFYSDEPSAADQAQDAFAEGNKGFLSFFSKFLNNILSIFGLGGGSDIPDTQVASNETTPVEDTGDIGVPTTEDGFYDLDEEADADPLDLAA